VRSRSCLLAARTLGVAYVHYGPRGNRQNDAWRLSGVMVCNIRRLWDSPLARRRASRTSSVGIEATKRQGSSRRTGSRSDKDIESVAWPSETSTTSGWQTRKRCSSPSAAFRSGQADATAKKAPTRIKTQGSTRRSTNRVKDGHRLRQWSQGHDRGLLEGLSPRCYSRRNGGAGKDLVSQRKPRARTLWMAPSHPPRTCATMAANPQFKAIAEKLESITVGRVKPYRRHCLDITFNTDGRRPRPRR